jgi:hypothetical protein
MMILFPHQHTFPRRFGLVGSRGVIFFFTQTKYYDNTVEISPEGGIELTLGSV